MGIVGRRCVRYKDVRTGNGVARRCAEYGTSEEIDHSMSFGRYVPRALTGSMPYVIGAVGGLAGGTVLRWVSNMPAVSGMIPDVARKVTPALGGALAGMALYAITKNKAHAVGAVSAGVAINVWDVLKGQFPALGELVTYSIPGYGYYGMLQREAGGGGAPGQYGALIDDPRPGMAELAAMSMTADEEAAP